MLKWSLAAIAAVVVIFLIVVALQPADFKVERSATLRAPAPAAFAQVNDFRNWQAWSPWEKVDPALRSRPGELVRIRLEFFKPMAAVNTTEFRFRPAGADTTVTWTMTGQNNFLSKMFCLFVDMDRMVGGMFDQGLTQMKAIVERRA